MPPLINRFDQKLFFYLDNLKNYLRMMPLNLGGTAIGSGAPYGGFIGYLPQTQVSYDPLEAELSGFVSADPYNISGILVNASILDNMNHIRYRLSLVEAIASGITITDDDVLIGQNISELNFGDGLNAELTDLNEVTVTLNIEGSSSSGYITIASGVYDEDVSSQLPGPYTTTYSFLPESLRVYYNGLRQNDDDVTIINNTSFSTQFVATSGDVVIVDYNTMTNAEVSGILITDSSNHIHTEYITLSGAEDLFVTQDELLAMYFGTVTSGSFTAEGDLIVGAGFHEFTVLSKGTEGQILTTSTEFDNGIGWSSSANTVNQQVVFAIEGANLYTEEVKPLKIYMHDVGNSCEITEVVCAVNVPPIASGLHIDVMKNGTSIFNVEQYVDIPIGSGFITKAGDFSDNSLYKNDYLQIEVAQGDPAASDLTVHVRFSWEM